MQLSDFDYELPPDLIAREPARPRDASRMMVLNRETGEWRDSAFRNLPEFLRPSDVLVLNDTRVIRARIYGRLKRASGTTREVEVLFAARRVRTPGKSCANPESGSVQAIGSHLRMANSRDFGKLRPRPSIAFR